MTSLNLDGQTGPAGCQPDDEFPVLDLGAYLEGQDGAAEELALQLRVALERVGFYLIRNHGISQTLIDAVFQSASQFFALPDEEKKSLLIDRNNIGYLPLRGNTIRHSTLSGRENRPDLAEGFFVKRDLMPDHPDVVAGVKFRGVNRWPGRLPGFRLAVLAYMTQLENLALALLPLYALALDLPRDFFAPGFTDPFLSLRLSHYPQSDPAVIDEYGVAPHTDTGFMTLLAQNKVPGLEIQTRQGTWIPAPAIPGSFVVNSGDMLRRWSNDRVLSTPHRVLNISGQERYSIPLFFDADLTYPMTCLPSCQSTANPPKYDPITMLDYMTWQQKRNFDVLNRSLPQPQR